MQYVRSSIVVMTLFFLLSADSVGGGAFLVYSCFGCVATVTRLSVDVNFHRIIVCVAVVVS